MIDYVFCGFDFSFVDNFSIKLVDSQRDKDGIESNKITVNGIQVQFSTYNHVLESPIRWMFSYFLAYDMMMMIIDII